MIIVVDFFVVVYLVRLKATELVMRGFNEAAAEAGTNVSGIFFVFIWPFFDF